MSTDGVYGVAKVNVFGVLLLVTARLFALIARTTRSVVQIPPHDAVIPAAATPAMNPIPVAVCPARRKPIGKNRAVPDVKLF